MTDKHDYSDILEWLSGIRSPWTGQIKTAIETLTRELAEAKVEIERLNKAGDGDCALIYAQSAELTATKERLGEAVETLQDVVNPLGSLQREADAQGARLNGNAYLIANDLGFVQTIARRFLAKQEASQ